MATETKNENKRNVALIENAAPAVTDSAADVATKNAAKASQGPAAQAAQGAAAQAAQGPAAQAAQGAAAQAAQGAAAQAAQGAAAQAAQGAMAQAAQGAAAAQKMMEDGAGQARATMEQTMQQITKTTEGFYKAAEEAAEFGRGNLEAMTRATQTLTSGMQDLSKQYLAMSQAMGEHAMESAKALSGVKSLKEAADIQAAFAKASMERSMSETAKLQEAAYRLVEQTGAPLAARMTLAVEKFSKPIAA